MDYPLPLPTVHHWTCLFICIYVYAILLPNGGSLTMVDVHGWCVYPRLYCNFSDFGPWLKVLTNAHTHTHTHTHTNTILYIHTYRHTPLHNKQKQTNTHTKHTKHTSNIIIHINNPPTHTHTHTHIRIHRTYTTNKQTHTRTLTRTELFHKHINSFRNFISYHETIKTMITFNFENKIMRNATCTMPLNISCFFCHACNSTFR